MLTATLSHAVVVFLLPSLNQRIFVNNGLGLGIGLGTVLIVSSVQVGTVFHRPWNFI